MKTILFAACILGIAACAPQQRFMEFDLRNAPAQAAQAGPAGAPVGTPEVLLPVNAPRQRVRRPVRGFIKQEILMPGGRETKEVFFPFGFDLADSVATGPSAAPAAPAAPAALAQPVIAPGGAGLPGAKPSGDDDDDDD